MTLNTKYQVFVIGSTDSANPISVPAVRDGEIKGVSQSQLAEALNAQEKFVFSLPSKDGWCKKIVLSQTQIQVARNGVVVWWGIVTNLDGNGIVNTYTAQDFSFLLTKRYIAPVTKVPYYSTRFQLANTARNKTHIPPTVQGNFRNSAFVADTFATNGMNIVASTNGVQGTDILWKLNLNGDNGDLYYNTNSTSRWDGRAFQEYAFTTFGNQPGTVYSDNVGSPDIWIINTAATPLNNDENNIPITPYPGAGNYVTVVNWGGTHIDVSGTMTGDSRLGGHLFRRWIMNNNTQFPKDIHAVVYVRLNYSDFIEDIFSSNVQSLQDPATFNTFDVNTWQVTPPVPNLVKFGTGDTTYTGNETSGNLDLLNWVDAAMINTDGVPASVWSRLILSSTIPALSSNVNFEFQFMAATPSGYEIGGLDIFIDDGLFYANSEQGQIVSDILSYVQNSTNGWNTLAINTNVAVGSGNTSSPRTKEYLFSDYQTAYDALWEYTTLYQGFDFGWSYANMNRQFNAYFSPGTPGANIGSVVGKGAVQNVTLTHGIEIVGYSVTGDGSQMADIVGVFEPTSNTIEGSARDFVTAQNVPTGRWQLAEVYEGTPGGSTLTLQSQAQRGLNRYGMPSWSLNITLDPKQSDAMFALQVGDVVKIVLPELGFNGVQFRITGRTTNLATDIVTLTIQQYFGV